MQCFPRAANPDDVTPFEEMKKLAFDITPRDCLGVMKTFSIALNLVNAAEVHHRIRLVRGNENAEEFNHHIGPLPMIEDSIRGTMEILLEMEGVSGEKIFERLITQKCEIVLTAHPTEVNRKTIIRKCEWFACIVRVVVWHVTEISEECYILLSSFLDISCSQIEKFRSYSRISSGPTFILLSVPRP